MNFKKMVHDFGLAVASRFYKMENPMYFPDSRTVKNAPARLPPYNTETLVGGHTLVLKGEALDINGAKQKFIIGLDRMTAAFYDESAYPAACLSVARTRTDTGAIKAQISLRVFTSTKDAAETKMERCSYSLPGFYDEESALQIARHWQDLCRTQGLANVQNRDRPANLPDSAHVGAKDDVLIGQASRQEQEALIPSKPVTSYVSGGRARDPQPAS